MVCTVEIFGFRVYNCIILFVFGKEHGTCVVQDPSAPSNPSSSSAPAASNTGQQGSSETRSRRSINAEFQIMDTEGSVQLRQDSSGRVYVTGKAAPIGLVNPVFLFVLFVDTQCFFIRLLDERFDFGDFVQGT